MAMKKPKVLAVLDEDLCTGCGACVHVCPVDCIETIAGPKHPSVMAVCSVDLTGCIGCRICAEICPWNCIAMVETDRVLEREDEKWGVEMGANLGVHHP